MLRTDGGFADQQNTLQFQTAGVSLLQLHQICLLLHRSTQTETTSGDWKPMHVSRRSGYTHINMHTHTHMYMHTHRHTDVGGLPLTCRGCQRKAVCSAPSHVWTGFLWFVWLIFHIAITWDWGSSAASLCVELIKNYNHRLRMLRKG